jgi:hypothetical protein
MQALRRPALLPAALAALAFAPGCRSSSTILHVQVDLAGVSTEQLEFTVLAEDGMTVVVPPTLRPASPAGPLASPQDVIIYLPDTAGTVISRVASVTTPPARDQHAVAVVPHHTVVVQLMLGATDRDNGQPCTDASQCASTYCVDGVCCDSACDGMCSACDVQNSVGACTMVPAGEVPRRSECPADPAQSCGLDGKCDGNGACSKYPVGMECSPAACTADGHGVMTAARCDGMGRCVPSTTSTPCDPYLCDSSTSRCFTGCTTVAECAAPNPCNAGKCGKKPNGDLCGDASECNSGRCADGVCCNIDCTGACTACNLNGSPGICTALPAGALDQHSQCTDEGATSCGGSGLCNGMGGCQKYTAGTVCAPVDCSGASYTAARVCDGSGTCLPANPTPCPNNFICNPATKTCFTSCTTNDQCTTGYTCRQPARCR